MLFLPNVELVCADSITPIDAIKSIEICCKQIIFKKVTLFTDKDLNHKFINIKKIDELKKIEDYSMFMINKLPYLVDSDYTLVVQKDGFILNPNRWSNKFLEYDYIGAPWDLNGCKVWNKKIRIGNGGFSLRSKKLMEELKSVKGYDGVYPEDSFISDFIFDKGLKYPSTDVAVNFSLECPLEDYPFDLNNCFGFHGSIIYNFLKNKGFL